MKINILYTTMTNRARDEHHNFMELAVYMLRFANSIAEDCKDEEELVKKVEDGIAHFGAFTCELEDASVDYILKDLSRACFLKIGSKSEGCYLH